METFNEFPREIDFFFFQKEMQLQNKIKKKFDIKIKYHSKICLIFFQGYHYATKTRITRHKHH